MLTLIKCFSNGNINIRNHAIAVGVILALEVVVNIVYDVVVYYEEVEDISKGSIVMYIYVAKTIALTFCTTVYWIGFLKRKRWCLTLMVILLVAGFLTRGIFLSSAIMHKDIAGICAILLNIVLTAYIYSVTCELRRVYLKDEIAKEMANELKEMPNARNEEQHTEAYEQTNC